MRIDRFFLSALTVVASAVPVAAEEATPAAAPDFSAGLEKLAALGVPKLDGARWASGPALQQLSYGGGDQPWSNAASSHYLQQVLGPLAQQAWYAPATATSSGGVMFPGRPEIVPLRPPGQFPEEMRASMEKQFARQLKALKPATLASELDGMLARLEKQAEEWRSYRAGSSGSSPWHDAQEAEVAGGLMVFAAQLWRAGERDAANRVAAAVFAALPPRDRVLNAALSRFADAELLAASRALMRTGDWSAYGASVRALLKKYPRGWESASAVALLADQVDARLKSDGTPVFPAGFNPEPATRDALAGVFRLSPATGPNRVTAEEAVGALWLLPPVVDAVLPTSYSHGSQTAALSRPEVKQLRGAGLAALPTLAALMADETPVLLPWVTPGSRYSSPESAEAKRTRLYAALPRPMTRGELVRAMVTQVIPGEEYNVEMLSPEALVASVEAFVAEHGKSDPVALALVYLETGGHLQRAAALHYLTYTSDPRASAGVEAWLLASDLEGQLESVKAYLRKDPAKKKVFAKKIEARLRENLALPDERPEGMYSRSSRKGVTLLSRQQLERELKEIADLASGKTVRERLLEAVADPDAATLPTLVYTVRPELQALPVGERVALLLEVAERAKEPEAKATLLNVMSVRPLQTNGEAPTASGYVLPARDSDEARRWRLLFEDSGRWNLNLNVGDLAAIEFENLFEPVPPAIAFILGKGGEKNAPSLMMRRARARLAGEPIPAYPDVSRVTPERLQARVAVLAATPDDRWASAFASGNEDDDLALQLWWTGILNPGFSAPGVSLPEVPLPPALRERMRRLGAIPTHDSTGAPVTEADRALTARVLDAVGLKPGDVVDAARLDAAVATLAGSVGDHSGVLVTVGRMSPGPALSALAYREPIRAIKPESFAVFRIFSEQEALRSQLTYLARRFGISGERGVQGADAALALASSVGGSRSERIWRVKDGVVTPPASLDTSDGAEIPTPWQLVILTAKDADILRGKSPATPVETGAAE